MMSPFVPMPGSMQMCIAVMASKQDPLNLNENYLSSATVPYDVNSSRSSEPGVHEMVMPVRESHEAELQTADYPVRGGQYNTNTEHQQVVTLGCDRPLDEFQPAEINISGKDLFEGTTTSPVQEKLKQPQAVPPKTNTEIQLSSGQKQDDNMQNPSQSCHCLEAVVKLQSIVVNLQRDFSKLTSLHLALQTYCANNKTLLNRKATLEKNKQKRKMASLIRQSARLSLMELESRLRKDMKDQMKDMFLILKQEINVINKVTGISPDSSTVRLWKELLTQSAGRFEPGMFFEVDPGIISYECSTRPNGKALVYVRKSFEGLFESIMSVHNAHRVQSTASNQTANQRTDRSRPDPTTNATQDRMESNNATGSTTVADQTNPIATATAEKQTDELPTSTTTAISTPITGDKDEATLITGPGNKYLVTGTPGIGKSCFAYFLLPHLLAKEGDSVLYQNCHNDMKYFVVITRLKGNYLYDVASYQMPNNCIPKLSNGLLGKGKDSVPKAVKPVSWYIFDSGHKSGAKPESTDVPTIVISSPDCDQYKDFMLKCPEKFYMPTWEWSEIDTVVRQLHPEKSSHLNASIQRAKADYRQEEINNEEKKKRILEAIQSFPELARASETFSKHGGVIRDVLNPCSEGRLEALHAAVNQSNVKMVLQFLQARGDTSSAVSHRILHQKCDKMLENGFVDYQNPSIHFASEHMHDRFWAKHLQNNADLKIEQLSLMYELIPADGSQHSEECRRKFGGKFEDLVHSTIASGAHKAKELLSDKANNKLKSISLEFTSKIIRPSQYQKTDDHIVCTIDTKAEDKEAYVRPGKGNFPAFDAFLPNQKYLLQITITKNHPVAVPELLSFINTRRWSPKDVTLMFVVLGEIYDSFPHQGPKKTRDCTPDEIEGFKKIRQCALPMPPRQLLHKQ